MKKEYINPSMEVIEITTQHILANSMVTHDEQVNTDDIQFGREDNTPSNPNLWDQGW